MRKSLLLLLLPVIFMQCSKDAPEQAQNKDIASPFIGNWTVSEHVTNIIGTVNLRNSFTAHTIKITDTSFAIIQTNRVPRPSWIGPPSPDIYSLDTMVYAPQLKTGKLNWIYGGGYFSNLSSFSANKDTLRPYWFFAVSSNADGGYLIDQTWVRRP